MIAMRNAVLLVDDERDFREDTAANLERAGFTVTTAGDAAEAEAEAHDVAFEVAIVDLYFGPEVADGVDIAQALLKGQPDLEIAFLTGVDRVLYHTKAEERGIHASQWLDKPVPTGERRLRAWHDMIRGFARRTRFRRLTREWREATVLMSSVREMAVHPAYQQIIGVGSQAVPWILEELRKETDHWFWALKAITGEDPVREQDRGNLQAMTAAWLELAKQRHWGEEYEEYD